MDNNIRPLISVVSPVYKAEKIVLELVKQNIEQISKITNNFEIILVEDCSPDNSWEAIISACAMDSRVKGVRLSRNFGQHYAITAGLRYAKGEWVVVMDCDLQDNPKEIINLYSKALEGYNIVYARRFERQDKFMKRLSSKMFYAVYNYLSGLDADGSVANFGIYNHKVIDSFNRMGEHSRSFVALLSHLGYTQTAIDVEHLNRYEGASSYSFKKLVKLAIDVCLANSNKPLVLTAKLGFTVSLISLFLALYNVIAYFTHINDLPGYTTTVFSIWFVGGLLMLIMGIIGLYIGKIFDEVKARPLFIVEESINI